MSSTVAYLSNADLVSVFLYRNHRHVNAANEVFLESGLDGRSSPYPCICVPCFGLSHYGHNHPSFHASTTSSDHCSSGSSFPAPHTLWWRGQNCRGTSRDARQSFLCAMWTGHIGHHPLTPMRLSYFWTAPKAIFSASAMRVPRHSRV